jgi:hypothetical protein
MTEGNGTRPQRFSGPRTAKSRRGRPEAAGTAEIRDLVDELQGRFERMTVRQIFYAVEVAELVPKTEAGYRRVQRLLAKMRRCGDLSWSFIADGTRVRRMVAQWNDLADYIDSFEDGYRRNLWRDQGVRIEVWLEKDALAEVVIETTSKWRVPLMVSRGQSSVTFLHSAAMESRAAYRHNRTETWIYALYDHDAGGERAARSIAQDLPAFALVPIHFERLAVTAEQIEEWDLPTRPAKDSDPQAAQWGDKPAVELDAIPVDQLHQLVEDAITRHINFREWENQQTIEAEEREGLLSLRDGLSDD